jgi:diaminobutyrate-pyruvate transaminase/4-aminobutyrate aminotransferase/(S)-3-amino-2-methylpropionate transaminase
MLFAPVGFGGASVKISPPLVIEEDALQEGAAVLGQATEEAVAATTS